MLIFNFRLLSDFFIHFPRCDSLFPLINVESKSAISRSLYCINKDTIRKDKINIYNIDQGDLRDLDLDLKNRCPKKSAERYVRSAKNIKI
jgi:hypothetical protein